MSGPGPGGRTSSVFVISITPFTADGALDEVGLRAHLRRMAAGGVGVYLGGGGSGEGYTLSPQETELLLRVGVEELAGAVPVRAMGVEPRTAAEMAAFVRLAAGCGVEAVQVYSLDQGHGHRPTPEEVRRYFRDVLEAVGDVPVALSTHQSVGYQVPAEFVGELVTEFPNLVGINTSHQDLGYLAELVDAVAGRADVHVGGPAQALSALALGAQGFLTSEANLAPRLCAAVIQAYRDGDLGGLLDSYGRVARLSSGLYSRGGIRATKAVLGALGLPGGFPRPPQLPVTGAVLDGALELVASLGLAGIEGW